MNRLELVPTIRAASSYGDSSSRPCLHLSVQVDGIAIGDRHVVDWRELWISLKEPGEYFFWTSLRGEPLEENIHNPTFVERDAAAQTVSWRVFLPVSLSDPSVEVDELQLTFDTKDYESAFRSAWWGARKLLKMNPDALVLPLGWHHREIDGLYEFLKTSAAKPVEPSYAPFPHPVGEVMVARDH